MRRAARERRSILRLAASGFVPVRPDGDALCRAVTTAEGGALVLPPFESLGDRPPALPTVSLTLRERDVLRLIAGGSSTEVAAHQLHLSPTTLKTHLRNAGVKLGTSGRAAAAARATALGLLG
jgi:DNA-binding NarL/FixJ family response regulator